MQKRHVTYRIGSLGPAWQRIDVEGNDLAFHHPGRGAIGVHATCEGYEDVPPPVLLNHLLFGTTSRRYLLEEEVTVDGRGAQHAVVLAELDGVTVRTEMYVLTRSGCVFDLSYVSGREGPAADEFARFVQGFQVEAIHRD